jgi:hypothetical protein
MWTVDGSLPFVELVERVHPALYRCDRNVLVKIYIYGESVPPLSL